MCDDGAMTLVIAHRGASAARPENTIAAFSHAVELGADGIELDVRRTGDDQLVVHHDATCEGRVIRTTHRSELPDHVAGLADALDACAGAFVNIEIKNNPSEPDHDRSDWVARRVAGELVRRGADARWLVSSFRYGTIAHMRRLLPAVRTAWLVFGLDDAAITRCAGGGHQAVHPYVDTIDAAAMRAAHGAGLAVNAWTCNDPDRMRELIAWGVDGICTDVPDVAVAVRAEIATRASAV